MPLFGVGTDVSFICQAGIMYFWGDCDYTLWSLLFPLQGWKYGKEFSRCFAFYALISASQVISHSRASQFQAVKGLSVMKAISAPQKLSCRCFQHLAISLSTGRGKWSLFFRKMECLTSEKAHIDWCSWTKEHPGSTAQLWIWEKPGTISSSVGWAGPVYSMEEFPCAWQEVHGAH